MPRQFVHDFACVGVPDVDKSVCRSGWNQGSIGWPRTMQEIFFKIVLMSSEDFSASLLGCERSNIPSPQSVIHRIGQDMSSFWAQRHASNSIIMSRHFKNRCPKEHWILWYIEVSWCQALSPHSQNTSLFIFAAPLVCCNCFKCVLGPVAVCMS